MRSYIPAQTGPAREKGFRDLAEPASNLPTSRFEVTVTYRLSLPLCTRNRHSPLRLFDIVLVMRSPVPVRSNDSEDDIMFHNIECYKHQ